MRSRPAAPQQTSRDRSLNSRFCARQTFDPEPGTIWASKPIGPPVLVCKELRTSVSDWLFLGALDRAARRYAGNRDPLVEASNWAALTVGSHLPFWPLYVWWAAGVQAFPTALLTVSLTPVFLAIPWLSTEWLAQAVVSGSRAGANGLQAAAVARASRIIRRAATPAPAMSPRAWLSRGLDSTA